MTDDFETRVREAVDTQKFNDRARELIAAGQKSVPQFGEAVRTIAAVGLDRRDAIEDMLAISKTPERVIVALAADPERAARIASMNQRDRMVELAKVDLHLNRPAPPPAPPRGQPSGDGLGDDVKDDGQWYQNWKAKYLRASR
jgi:hypothetical protein